jgi:hypothetical protein
MAELAMETGGYAEQLEAEEYKYSKKHFLNSVHATDSEKNAGQIQATFSIFKVGHEQIQFAQNWISWSDPALNYWQHPDSNADEVDNFIEHRNDQSLFSILWKRESFSKNPVSRNYSGFRSDIFRGASEPLHTIRNRSGQSQIPKSYHFDVTGKLGNSIAIVRNTLG